jgi:hypothetical protein
MIFLLGRLVILYKRGSTSFTMFGKVYWLKWYCPRVLDTPIPPKSDRVSPCLFNNLQKIACIKRSNAPKDTLEVSLDHKL